MNKKYASAAAHVGCAATEWMLDSAASDHYVNQRDPSKVTGTEKPAHHVVQTANHDITIKSEADAMAPGIGRLESCKVLKDGPNLASMGCLVEDLDYNFSWSKTNGAVLRDPAGHVVPLRVENRVPILSAAAVANERQAWLETEMEEFFECARTNWTPCSKI